MPEPAAASFALLGINGRCLAGRCLAGNCLAGFHMVGEDPVFAAARTCLAAVFRLLALLGDVPL